MIDKTETDKRIANWQMFYLNNLDLFNKDYLKINLHQFQKQIMVDVKYNDYMIISASRGLSKTFTIALCANSLALLLPNIKIVVAASTLGQANKIIDYIEKVLCNPKNNISPVMQQFYVDGYVYSVNNKTSNGKELHYGNGATIIAVACSENGRSNRANIAILDEARLVKKGDYDSIIEPFLEPYNYKGLFLQPKQILMTSARTKDNWVWSKIKLAVHNHYCRHDIKYGFFAGDILTAVANGIQTKMQYQMRMENTNHYDFDMEYLNLWQGDSENNIFKMDEIHQCQVLQDAFYPISDKQFWEGKTSISCPKQEGDIRFVCVDIALSGGVQNDNTIIMCGVYNINTHKRRIEYLTSLNGCNSVNQVIKMKRIYYDYDAEYFVMDSKGVGLGIYDLLTVKTFDDVRNVTYPTWCVCMDKLLQISSDDVVTEKLDRVMDVNAKEVIIPIAGTKNINSDMHLSVKNNIREKNLELLIDDAEKEAMFIDKDAKWVMKDADTKADLIIPFIETRLLINETMGLNIEVVDKIVRVKEKSGETKDRYMTLAMFSYFSDKLASKMLNVQAQEQGTSEFNLDDWKFLGDLCS